MPHREGGAGGRVLDRARACFAALRTRPGSTHDPAAVRTVGWDSAARGHDLCVESDAGCGRKTHRYRGEDQ